MQLSDYYCEDCQTVAALWSHHEEGELVVASDADNDPADAVHIDHDLDR